MKKSGLLIALLMALLICSNSFAEPKKAKAKDKKAVAEAKIKEAAVAVGEYTYFKREEFVNYSKRELAKMKKELASLEIKAKQKTASVKEESHQEALKKIDELKISVDQLNEKVKKVKGARQSEWDELQKSFNYSMDNIKYSIRKSRQWLSKKIAP